MSLNVNIPLSGQLVNTDDLNIRENAKGTAMLYFKLAVKESDKANGREKTHFLNCVAHGKKAENLLYSVRNGLITTRTRLTVSVGIDTYSKTMLDPSTNKQVEVQQVSFTVWELSVSAQFAPIADVSSPGFQQLMNQMPQGQGGYQNQPQQGYAPQQGQGGYPAQNQNGYQPQGQGGYQNQPQQGYAPQQGQGGYPAQNQNGYQPQGQGGYQNQPQQGYAPQQGQGGYPAQNQNGYQPQGQGGYQNQPQQSHAPQQGQARGQHSPQEQLPRPAQERPQNQQEAEQAPQAEQGKSMRSEPLLDGEDF